MMNKQKHFILHIQVEFQVPGINIDPFNNRVINGPGHINELLQDNEVTIGINCGNEPYLIIDSLSNYPQRDQFKFNNIKELVNKLKDLRDKQFVTEWCFRGGWLH